MSNTSYFHDNDLADADFSSTTNKSTTAVKTAPSTGFFARMFASIVRAREVQARHEANRYLARQPDRLLYDIGFDATEIADLRRRYDA